MEVQINATKDQIEDLKSSVLWNDIVNELEGWKERFVLEQSAVVDDATEDNLSTASVLLRMGDLNGRVKAVDYVLSIPDVFLGILEDKKNDTKRESTD